MPSLDLTELEAAMKLIEKYQIDSLELPNGIKLSKSLHKSKRPRGRSAPKLSSPPSLPVNFQEPDEIVFAQSSAPALSLDDLTNFRN